MIRSASNNKKWKNKKLNNKNKNSKVKFKTVIEFIGVITAIVSTFSFVSVFFQKYMNFGRCFYFDFDMNYYDFSLTTESIFVFVFTFIAGILGVTLSSIQNTVWNTLDSFIKSHKIRKIKSIIIKLIVVILMLALVAFIIVHMTIMLIPSMDYRKIFGGLICFFYVTTFVLLRGFDLKSKKAMFIAFAIICISLVITIACAKISEDYNSAKDQREFPIIFEGQKTYVVISEGKEEYSAYQCVITDDKLMILVDVHKYFDIQCTKTIPVEFKDVEKKDLKPIPSEKVEKYLKDEYNLSQPYEIEYYNENI